MEIAKNITGEQFLRLDLSSAGKDWSKAILMLRLRITERFIEPTDKLIELESSIPAKGKKYGFAILALDCLLCETIQSFYEGVENSKGHSKQLFVKFLRERQNFKSHFTSDADAEDFYINFRCSLLHQAQTSGSTKVWALGPLIKRLNGETKVNRLVFHQALKDEFELYISLLSESVNSALRSHFIKKMTYISTSG